VCHYVAVALPLNFIDFRDHLGRHGGIAALSHEHAMIEAAWFRVAGK